jgi:hypothetical protein
MRNNEPRDCRPGSRAGDRRRLLAPFEACAPAELSLVPVERPARHDEAARSAAAYDLGMLKRLLGFLRLRRASSPEDEQARAEAKRLREDMETLRTGAMTGSSDYLLYSGREGRRGQNTSGH